MKRARVKVTAFKLGDKVRISPDADPAFVEQQEISGENGIAVVTVANIMANWSQIKYPCGYSNVYPNTSLMLAGGHQPMPEPDFDLGDIHRAQRLYKKAGGA